MKKGVLIFLLGVFTNLFFICFVNGAVIQAENCSAVAVQNAIILAENGDIVQVPAGSCLWEVTGLHAGGQHAVFIQNKNIHLKGAGVGNTIIDWYHDGQGNYAPLRIITNTGFTISDFTFRKTEGTATQKGIIWADVSNLEESNFRIYNNHFDNIAIKAVVLGGDMKGIIDNNLFSGNVRGMDIIGSGDYSWEHRPWIPGSGDVVFIENNTFDQGDRYTSVSCHLGGRYTFRYNTVYQGAISTHGADSSARAGGVFEAYGNLFNASYDHDRAVMMRGGTAIIFNNEYNGYSTAIGLAQYRTCYGISWNNSNPGNAFRCDGSQPIDGNEARPGNTGSHTGDSHTTVMTDSTKAFPVNQFVGWHIWNLDDKSLGKITANTATTVTVETFIGGTNNEWKNGDSYKITSGWPCKDQVGRGPGGPIGNQPSQPVYQWNNKWSRYGAEHISPEIKIGSYWCENPSPADQIIANQDYFDEVVRPDYKPYIYPHPLIVAPFGTQICGEGEITEECWCEGIKYAGSGYCFHGYFDGQIVPEPDPEPEPPPEPPQQPTGIITLQDMLNSYGQYQRGEVSIDFFLERFLKWVVYK